jgi:hypothetical protein
MVRDSLTNLTGPQHSNRRVTMREPTVPVMVGGLIVMVVLWLAGAAGTVYIGYLIIMALKKYIGG